MQPLLTHYHTINRRIADLQAELDAWLVLSQWNGRLEMNNSQIQLARSYTAGMLEEYGRIVKRLNPGGDVDQFLEQSISLLVALTKTQSFWNNFRSRLQIRLIDEGKIDQVKAADIISHDCYTAVVKRVHALDIKLKNGFRDYPLVGTVAEYSPLTYPRGARLNHFPLPISLIDIPQHQFANPWELLTIAHEVGHDLDIDLEFLSSEINGLLGDNWPASGYPAGHLDYWQKWMMEILADFFGVLLAGPAFVLVLMELLLFPKAEVLQVDEHDPHPPHHLRILIDAALLRVLGLQKEAGQIEAAWRAVYREAGNFLDYSPEEISHIARVAGCSPLQRLRNREGRLYSLVDLVPFTPRHQQDIERVAGGLVAWDGKDLAGLKAGVYHAFPCRRLLSASAYAFLALTEGASSHDDQKLAANTYTAILLAGPRGQLAAEANSKLTIENLIRQQVAWIEEQGQDLTGSYL